MACAQPPAKTIKVTIPGLGDPIAARTVRTVASAVWTAVVVSSSVLRGTRSASAPPTGPRIAPGTNAGGGDQARPRRVPGRLGDVDADPDRLHPGADVGEERAGPERGEDAMAKRCERTGHRGANRTRRRCLRPRTSAVIALGPHATKRDRTTSSGRGRPCQSRAEICAALRRPVHARSSSNAGARKVAAGAPSPHV